MRISDLSSYVCASDLLKAVFELSWVQAMLVQFTFFGAYFLMSLPAGRLVAAAGYKKGIVAGLAIAGVGALLFWPAAGLHSYPLFLGALFVLATGIKIGRAPGRERVSQYV